MNFLLVLREYEAQSWGGVLSRIIVKNNSEAVIKTSIEEAQNFIRDKQFKIDEIITGSFGDLSGPWRTIQRVASDERNMSVTLLTGLPIDQNERIKLIGEGVKIIQTDTFDRDEFIAERFPTRNQREIK